MKSTNKRNREGCFAAWVCTRFFSLTISPGASCYTQLQQLTSWRTVCDEIVCLFFALLFTVFVLQIPVLSVRYYCVTWHVNKISLIHWLCAHSPVYQKQYLCLHSPFSLVDVLIWSRWRVVGRNHLGCWGRGVTDCDRLFLFRCAAQSFGRTTRGGLKSLDICQDTRKISVKYYQCVMFNVLWASIIHQGLGWCLGASDL